MTKENTPPDESLLLDLTNFESLHTQISLSSPKGKALPHPDFEIKLEEFDENSMTLEVGPGTLQRGDLVWVKVEVLSPQPHQMSLSVLGKVEELTLIHRGPDKILLTFQKIDQELWNQFRNLFTHRQEEILRYFERVKS